MSLARHSYRRAAPLGVKFRLAARVLRAHKRQRWPTGPQGGRIDPQESWAKP